jgi:dCTP deaminase
VRLLTRDLLMARLAASGGQSLYVEPLLEPDQVGEVTLDLRLGYDFLVSILTRKALVGINPADSGFRSVDSYFQATRREIGDRFILYPNQVVLTTTLEYVGLTADIYADVLPRSSYSCLGVHADTMMQPGYRGCFPVELTNLGNNPIEIVVGSRIFQARFFEVDAPTNYNTGSEPRKYFGTTRPGVSKAPYDPDLQRLNEVERQRNT